MRSRLHIPSNPGGRRKDMARRKRDYKAEERRRNELARQRGYKSRAAQRYAIETGRAPALQPSRVRKPTRTVKTPRLDSGALDRAYDWSALHGGTQIARYDYRNARPGVTKGQYLKGYLDAFVEGPQRYRAVRHSGGSRALERYFVDITGYYTADEYETRYGKAGQ